METSGKPRLDTIRHEKATCPNCGKHIFVRYQQSPQLRILGLVSSNGVSTTSSSNPDIDAIYNFWNSQHIIAHKNMTTEMARAIKSALKEYSDTDIIQAIRNYAEIHKGEQYWFKYTWTLRDFLKRGIPKFLDLDIARKNYIKKEIAPKGKPIHKECLKCGYKALTVDAYCPKCSGELTKDYSAGKYGHLVQR